VSCAWDSALSFVCLTEIDSDFRKESIGIQFRIDREHGRMRARNYYECIRFLSESDHLTEADLPAFASSIASHADLDEAPAVQATNALTPREIEAATESSQIGS
jgi:hypothetical protein